MSWDKLLSAERLGRTDKENFDEGRSPFQKDYDRIVFSSPFRRLQDKTQVFPLANSDYVRTRLTHSLEVSCVGRSLGTQVGAKIVKRGGLPSWLTAADFGSIVAAACLAHDLGNPPFGHSGERAIQHWFSTSPAARSWRKLLTLSQRLSIKKYEGNAQGFRIITKLLAPDNPGLQLTFATLGTFQKYPIEAAVPARLRGKDVAAKKFGFFETEEKEFEAVATKVGLLRRSSTYCWFCRHPLSFLMEAADDISNRIVDFEDGCRMGLIEESVATKHFLEIIDDSAATKKASMIKDETARLQYLRARAIAELVDQAAKAFLSNESLILEGRFLKPLVHKSVIRSGRTLTQIEDITKGKVYPARQVVEIEAAGFEIIGGLLDTFVVAINDVATKKPSHRSKKLYDLVSKEFRSSSKSPFVRLMSVCDFICGMTDSFALNLFRRVKGISLETIR